MRAPYFIGVDIGTSRTAAATARLAPDRSLFTDAFCLGRNTDSTPTAVYVGDAELLFGEPAERRGAAEPGRLIREFKRRIGDDVPVVAGDRHLWPEELYAHAVDEVIRTVSEREGSHPSGVAITVPATWGPHRTELVSAAIARRGWSDVELITEPEAAARHYESTRPLAVGRALGVYDLGGGTFDAVVLRKDDDDRVRIVGRPVGIAELGGSDFDDLVLRHALRTAGIEAEAWAVAGDRGRVTLASLRRECVEAKESLSFDGETVIPVLTDGNLATVRLTRAEFEDMIDDRIEQTVAAFDEALSSAGVEASELDAILLTGGSSRIPRIAQVLSERFGRPIAVDADPKAIIALGAARAIAQRAQVGSPSTDLARAAGLGAVLEADEAPASDDDAPTARDENRPRRRAWFRRTPTIAALGACALIAGGGLAVVNASALGFRGQDAARSSIAVDAVPPLAGLLAPRPADDAAAETAPVADAPPARSPDRASEAAEPRRAASPRALRQDRPDSRRSAPAGSNAPSRGSSSLQDDGQKPQPSTPPKATPTPAPSRSGPEPTQPAGPTNPPAQPAPSPVEPAPSDPAPSDPPPSDPPAEPAPTGLPRAPRRRRSPSRRPRWRLHHRPIRRLIPRHPSRPHPPTSPEVGRWLSMPKP
ncbi:Hsp70 family protein [Microbacterium sp. Marseille-Q6965]|uniref:Hsp70 family protein n=1 Tax=Microbacterium sp. Marseille-Q6965 TaxID=2965072 RepID=UPI0021B70CD8|nr:Hsp70 family protein [Microbacterium sp. Marseille-Q6965]